MAVITISRELGSDGTIIAKQTAETLGYPLVDKTTIEHILSQYGFVHFGKDYETVPNFWERLDPSKGNMITMLNRVILAMACYDNLVILGRGSFAVLGGYADVLNVRIQSPLPVRIKRIMKEQNIKDPFTAESLVKESDKVRSAFIQSWYNVRWDQAEAFDLIFDTSKIPAEMASRWISEAAKKIKSVQGNNKPTTQTILVDQELARAVAAGIKLIQVAQ